MVPSTERLHSSFHTFLKRRLPGKRITVSRWSSPGLATKSNLCSLFLKGQLDLWIIALVFAGLYQCIYCRWYLLLAYPPDSSQANLRFAGRFDKLFQNLTRLQGRIKIGNSRAENELPSLFSICK